MNNVKENGVLYTEKVSNLTAEIDDSCFTSYNWWKQTKECVKPLLASVEANIEVSLSMRQEQIGRCKSKYRFVPINEETCLVVTHTKQAEEVTQNSKWNTIYCYKVDWVKIMARLANKGYRAPYLVNMTVKTIFKKVGREKNPNYLGRWFKNMDNINGIHVIEELPKVIEIPLGRKEYKSFILPMEHKMMLKVELAKEVIQEVNLYHNYSDYIYNLSITEARQNVELMWKMVEMLLATSLFTVGGGKVVE